MQAAVLTAPTDLMRLIAAAGCTAAIFDLDGVVTQTRHLHVLSWQQALDEFLAGLSTGRPFRPFDPARDYPKYLDGRTRREGLLAFLASRGLELPPGQEGDAPFTSVAGLGDYKNSLYLESLAKAGIEIHDDAVAFIGRLRDAGFPVGLATSSRNASLILSQTRLGHLFDVVVDGNDVENAGLRSKPAPDIFLQTAARLGHPLQRCAVFEDTLAVLDALIEARPGYAVGVARNGRLPARKPYLVVAGFDD